MMNVSCAGGDPSVALEQLWWLACMAGALLADTGDGETPLPPLPLASAVANVTPDSDPVARLSRELLGLLALALEPSARPALSPRCATCATCQVPFSDVVHGLYGPLIPAFQPAFAALS